MSNIPQPKKIENLIYKYNKQGISLDLIPAIKNVVYISENPENLQFEIYLYANTETNEKFDSVVVSAPIGLDKTELIKKMLLDYLVTNAICAEIQKEEVITEE